MNDCTTCKFERQLMYCLQGHVRKIKYSMEDKVKVLDHEPIENCHGWGEKKSCWCKYPSEQRAHNLWKRLYIPGETAIYIEPTFCPECGCKLI